ncbi:MAG: hypothetical protein IPK80_11580 [Nannocystis sp.]|nr:hypothetical protein [Nannocystis sp.]
MAPASEPERRYRITVFRPDGSAGQQRTVALDITALTAGQLDQLRPLISDYLGPGFVAAVDGEIIARGPASSDPQPVPAIIAPRHDDILEPTRRLTELAIQQHEYCYAELQRLRRDYEEEFDQERAILRSLRQRWLEWVCNDKAQPEDALRYLAGVVRDALKRREDGTSGDGSASERR